jgi:hypothetical protein
MITNTGTASALDKITHITPIRSGAVIDRP